MSHAGKLTAARSLLTAALGAGVCYCLYRVLAARSKKCGSGAGLRDRVAGMTVTAGGRGSPVQSENFPKCAGNLEAHHLESLLQLLSGSSDSSAVEQILVTLCNSAAFSVNHDIIRNLDGLHIIGGFLSHPDLKIKAGALNALNNLSMNLQNQEQIQAFINEVLKNITESALNSEVQLAGLRLLINMSVTNNYHEKMVDYIPNLLHVLDGGNDTTKAPSALICLFDSSNTRDVLIRALTFSANLSENLGREQQCAGQARYKEDSLYAVLFEDPAALQRNLAPLLLFPDTEIKEQVKRCISAVRSKNS
ncbi:armadillo repeat-containing protein 10 isoform X2 [Ranitomeya imitator]|uniref:armadillo repeat-containing protein 10 isoform X2 n=1 Tax=Ranitomeya imitator TaxID=111125 RepID=UPI0037E86193